MTTVSVEQERLVDLLDRASLVGLRPPTLGGDPSHATRTLTWTPDLTPAEVLLARAIGCSVRITVAERDALEADIDGLRTYHGLASPTAAQTAQAVKAIIRVLRAILRD